MLTCNARSTGFLRHHVPRRRSATAMLLSFHCMCKSRPPESRWELTHTSQGPLAQTQAPCNAPTIKIHARAMGCTSQHSSSRIRLMGILLVLLATDDTSDGGRL